MSTSAHEIEELIAGASRLGFWIPGRGAEPGWITERALELLGPDAAALADAPPPAFLPLVAPADRDRLRQSLARLESSPGRFDTQIELCGREREGRRVHVMGHARAHRGALRLALSFSEAVSEVERALWDSQSMFQLVLDSIPVRVFWKDLDNFYLGCNHAFALDAGLSSPSEIVGKSDFELAWVEQADLYRSDDQRVMQQGRAKLHYEEPQNRPDGTNSWLRTSKVPMRDADGRIKGVLGCYEDITESKQMREQLARTQKMEAIGRLAGGIAHDFNNILTVVLGNIELLRSPKDAAEHEEALDELAEAAQQAATLNRRLLAFARQETFARVRLDLNDAIGDAQRMLRSLAGEDCTIEFQPASSEVAVVADPHQLQQVLMNLVVNARDSMSEGGTIRIATGVVEMGDDMASAEGALPGAHGWLSVEDDGCGIPDEERDRIFDPFFTTKPAGRGTGLGLSTVLGIVQQAGGHVSVSSHLGEGTRLTVRLPLAEADEERAEAREAAPPLAGTETVLLCEDEPALRRIARRALEGHGYTVLEAGHPHDALRISDAHDGPVHLLLTDVIMPDLRGPQLADRLTAKRPAMRVLYMSGYTADALEQRADLSRQVDLVPKPFGTAELLAGVRSVLDRD